MAEVNTANAGVVPSVRSVEKVANMTVIFQSKKWKYTAVTTFVVMNISALIVTLVLAVTVAAIGGNSGSETLATYTYSLKSIQYWIVGIAGIAFVSDGVAVVASMVKNRTFRLLVLALLAINIILTISLAIWGSADGEGRKSFFQYTWDKMDDDTKHLFQSYFSCCGFESIAEWQTSVLPIDESCYARLSDTQTNITWPNGCYDRVIGTYLNAVTINDGSSTSTFGESKANPFYIAFVLCFVLLAVMQTTILIMFVISIYSTPIPNHNEVDDNELTIRNPRTVSDEYSSMTNGATVGENGANGVSVTPDMSKHKTWRVDNDKTKKKWWTRLADSIAHGYAAAFYWVGVRVAEHPKMTIIFSLILVGSLSFGMVQRYESPSGSGVGFLSENSQILTETTLRLSIFFINERDQFMLIVDESDVLSTTNFVTTLNIDRSVKNQATDAGVTFSSICLQLDTFCKERSLFELWSFNDTTLDALTNTDILSKVNEDELVSPVFGDSYDVSHVIGGLQRDSSTNQITAARAHLLHYVTRTLNQDWEDVFINISRQQYDGLEVYGLASNSRRQESSGSFTKDLPLFFVGFVFIFIYILLMTGKFSLIEHRVYIALLGVAAAGLSMSAGIGLTSCVGLPWTNLHLIVPFLVLGIGVDDMFVLLQAFDSVQDDINNKHLTLRQKAGKALQNAGASITVTSVTDLVAFAVGATSELAGFASFSVFVAVCIIILFFLECTFFLSCIVLDERRKENRYDACLACCYQHDENYKPSKCGQRQILQTAFEDGLGRVVRNVPFAVVTICITLAVTGLMSWGFYKLEVRYDPNWYIPSTSYVVEYGNKYEEFFSVGDDASVYVINADFFNEREKLSTLFEHLQNNANLNHNYTTSWFESYKSWKNTAEPGFDVLANSSYANANEFYADVQTFLADTSGRKFIYDVALQNDVIVGSKFDIRHRDTVNQVENVDIISSIRQNCDDASFNEGASVFPFGNLYFVYEITRIIRQEVYRNIGITMLCVFLMVMPMLASVQMGFWVALCVAITTVNVAGTMYFAGLSIETSTIITLLLSIGLAVDYAAHIGHKFLSIKGTRQLRARVAVGQIGLAVFNGGFSTFLALVMLSLSDTYSYKVFFTVFVCVVAYGLWTGLVFLPCVLAVIGPEPHANAEPARLSSKHYEKNGKVNTSESISSPSTPTITSRQ